MKAEAGLLKITAEEVICRCPPFAGGQPCLAGRGLPPVRACLSAFFLLPHISGLPGPTWTSSRGFAIAAPGILIRALASGHIRKNAELATTGPYAYTRNPLYLGSIIIAVGFIIAARNIWIGIGALAMFAFIYLPVITAEEKYLRSAFPGYDPLRQ